MSNLVEFVSYPSLVKTTINFNAELLKNISNITINMKDGKTIVLDPKEKYHDLESKKKNIHQMINTNYFTGN